MTLATFGVIALFVLAVVVVHAVCALVLAGRMTRPKRVRVTGSPAALRLDHEDVRFGAGDGVALYGWYLQTAGARATVVVVHDNGGMRSDPTAGLLALHRDYVHSGFNVLAFDLRGRGESSGLRDQLGAGELSDVLGAVRYAGRRGGCPVFLHGFGTGAALALAAVADGAAVTGVIADSPVASMRAYVRAQHARVPGYVFDLAVHAARLRFGADIDRVAPVRTMQQMAETRVLFVHCEDNREVPAAHTLNLAAASLSETDEVWIRPEGGHCGAYLADPSQYMHRALRLIDHELPARVPAARAV